MEQTAAMGSEVEAALQEQAAAELSDFDALVRSEQRRIYRVVLSLVRDPDTADTLTQDCFLRAYQSRERFRGQCSVRTWLLRIAINLVRDHARNRRLQFWRSLFRARPEEGQAPEPLHPQPSAERALLARERLEKVWAVVQSLSLQQRTIFILRFVEEMEMEEIAEAMGLRPGTVKTHLFRAVSAIRREVGEQAL
jgi:RNA polymerase sigma-70 factor (ECF subfamily)